MSRIQRSCCGLAFLLSGASALTYEILWQRQMFLIFGASAAATTAILTAIFLGIACGSRLAVPLMRRFRNPFVLYAVIEVVIGVWGFLVPTILDFADQIYLNASAALGEGHASLYGIRFLLAIAAVLPATLAMGATIPVMVRCIGTQAETGAAWAYGINILGAVAGCLTTGLLWMRMFGIHQTRLVAVLLNVIAVVAILSVARAWQDDTTAEPETDDPVPQTADAATDSTGDETESIKGLAWLYFIAGFVALGFEVVWLRMLGIVNTNSTITFTLTLAIYLLGMGVGSLVVYAFLKRFIPPRTLFGWSHGGAAIAALLCFPVVLMAAELNFENVQQPAMAGTLTQSDLYWNEALIISWLMFLPAMFMGMTYPAMCDSYHGSLKLRDRWIGRSYFHGTLGSVLGILLVSMVIIPALGLHRTFAALVVTSAALCLISRWLQARSLPRLTLIACALMVAGAAYYSVDPQPLMRNAVARKVDGVWLEFAVDDPDTALSEIVRLKAGASATVMVRKSPDNDHLVFVDDQLVASTNLGAKVDSLMLAHLPLLLHPDPKSALTVGFGTGGTSHAMTVHDVETWCVEIEPEVPRSAWLMPDQNFNIRDNPRFHLILNDARDHLHAGQRHYDAIATDVTNLQYKQNGNLYTVEYFELMRDKLNPDGIACAWIPLAGIDLIELRILMKSFQAVFPHASLWFMNHTDTNFAILIGTPAPLRIDFDRLQYGFNDKAIADSLQQIQMSEPLQFVHCLHLDEEGYRQFCGDSRLHTDDMPILEFTSPMSFYRSFDTFEENLATILRLRPPDLRPYVDNVPTGMDEQFHRHYTASQRFCEVLLRFYRYMIARGGGDLTRCIGLLKQSVQLAESGMEAWPTDTAREEFYGKFFETANSWLRRNL